MAAGHQEQRSVEVRESVELTEKEERIFRRLLDVVHHFGLGTQLRVAGGWVRDKLLGKDSTDIDIALDNTTGRNFCEKVNEYSELMGEEQKGIGVIQCNPDQSKHLETARMLIFDIWIDFVNLRSEKYAENSRIPTMEIGTAKEDAYRRDLTINSLFFNINTNSVEDSTGRGIEDLKKGLIVTPLPAKATFLDDPLRVLRAIRFAARFNFTLAEILKKAASDEKVKSKLGSKISRERIGHKVDLMMLDKQPVTAMCYARDLGLFYIVFAFPEKLDPPVPPVLDKCDWLCVSHIEVALNLAHSIGCSVFIGGSDSKSQDEQRRLCLYSSHVTLECALPPHPNMVILGDSWPPRKQLLLNLESDDSAQPSQIETISQGRENFVKEIDIAVADVVMAIVADFMFVYLPAPTISLQPPLAMNAEHIATFFHNCPNEAFQIALTGRSYSLLQKLGAILRNGAKLVAVGTSAYLIGTGVTNALIKARKAVDKELDDEIKDIPIVSTSVVYGIYMAVSSNLRYQVLASVIEQRMLEPLLHNHKLLLEHFAYMVDILGMEKKLLVVRVWQFGANCSKYRLQTVAMRVRQKLKASDQVQWLHFRMLMQQKHGGDGLFREVFSIGYSVVFRCALMGNKHEAEKTETQLLRVFDYAWNKLKNGACRCEEILLKLEQEALGHGSSLLSRVRHFKHKMLGEKSGIKISKSGSVHISSGIMENMLPRICAFVGFRPQLVNSGDNVVDAIDIQWKNTSEGNTCGSKQAHGRRSEGYKVKKINVIKQRTVLIRDSNSVGGVILQDCSCLERPVQGRKRCAA